ncbi:MAG: TonB-dependent receptor [Bacteroidetes bacterium]|nr:TonB-dependent receptor [Bacteroidota bacterium]
MQKLILLISILFVLKQSLWSQNQTKDSVLKIINLEEVCVSTANDDKNQSFNFYKNNKLATTEDMLSRMQGVNLIKRGAYGLEPVLRNYGSGQTNLTIDGMKIYGACTDKMDPVSIYIEPINLSEIQVTHGASGTMNGSNIGGQINMELKKPEISCHTKLNGQISQSFLSVNNAYYISGAFDQSFKKFAYRINSTYRKANDYTAGGNNLIPYSGFEKSNIGFSGIYEITKLQSIKLDYIGDWGKNIGYPALPMDVGFANAQIISVTHLTKFKNNLNSFNNCKIYYNEITHQMDDTHRNNISMHMDMPGWTKTAGLFNELNINENFKLRLDCHNAYARADMTMYPFGQPTMYLQTLPENNLNNIGLSIKYKQNFKWNQQLNLTGRIDYYLQSAIIGPGYEQWKVFNFDISENLTNILKNVNASYSKSFKNYFLIQYSLGYAERLPTSNERYGFYLYNRQDQYDYIGNIYLKPEQSLQNELSFKFKNKKIETAINLFYHHISNFIYSYKLNGMSQMTIGAYGVKTYKNIDYAVSQGFEFNTKAFIANNLTYISSIKYIYAQTYNNTPLPLIAPLKLQHAIRYNFKLFQAQIEHDLASPQNRINVDYGDKKTPGFNLYNVRLSQNIPLKKTMFQLSLACENIFDLYYREHLDIGQIPRFGRNFVVNLSFLF